MDAPKFRNLSHITADENGDTISLSFENEHKGRLDVSFSKEDYCEFIGHLVDIGIHVAKSRARGGHVPFDRSLPIVGKANEISKIAIGESADGRSLLLFLRSYDFDLAFKTNIPQLENLIKDAAMALKAIGAGGQTKH